MQLGDDATVASDRVVAIAWHMTSTASSHCSCSWSSRPHLQKKETKLGKRRLLLPFKRIWNIGKHSVRSLS